MRNTSLKKKKKKNKLTSDSDNVSFCTIQDSLASTVSHYDTMSSEVCIII